MATDTEAETLKRLLDANGQCFEIAQSALLSNQARVSTVAEVVQEHIDLVIRPSSGSVRTYQVMLDRHVRDVIGHIPVDKLDYRQTRRYHLPSVRVVLSRAPPSTRTTSVSGAHLLKTPPFTAAIQNASLLLSAPKLHESSPKLSGLPDIVQE